MSTLLLTANANQCETGINPGVFTIDASDLARGQLVNIWPPEIATDLGTGQPFIFKMINRDADGDVTTVDYIQYPATEGCLELVVFND